MDPQPLHAHLRRLANHGEQVIDVTVDVPVRKESDEMKSASHEAVAYDLLPKGRFEDPPRGDLPVHELGPLIEDPAGPEGVVAHLGVPHVVPARKPDCRSVGPKPRVGTGGKESVQGRCARKVDRCKSRAAAYCPRPYRSRARLDSASKVQG